MDRLSSVPNDEWCMLGLPCAENPLRCPGLPLFAIVLGMRAKLRKAVDLWFTATESNKGAWQSISHMYAWLLFRECSPRSSCHQSRISMHDGREVELQWLNMKWMHIWTQQGLDSIMDNPECRRPGIETRSVTQSTKRPSFPVLRLTPMPSTMQYAWYAWMQP